MPLFGIIHDSPLIFLAQRGARRIGRGARAAGGFRPSAGTGIRYSKIHIVFNKPVLDYVLNSPEGMVGRYLAARGRRIVVAAKAQAGIKTGALKASIHMRQGRTARGQFIKVGSPLKYALAHHEGTRPHIITPKRAEVLRFSSRGRIVYARVVRHPGTKPNKYLTDNLYLIRL